MNALERLRGGLVVSVQAEADSVLNGPETIALLARCAVANGAVGVRIEGLERIRAVRAAVDVPIVGILKRPHAGFEPYITSTVAEVCDVAALGCELVAFDATLRPRSGGASNAELVAATHAAGALAMADCSDLADGAAAADAGADVVATTLAGYTRESAGRALPALELVAAFSKRYRFVICEGGVGTPSELAAAFAAGASAVVVGTAITNVDVLVRRFVAQIPRRHTT